MERLPHATSVSWALSLQDADGISGRRQETRVEHAERGAWTARDSSPSRQGASRGAGLEPTPSERPWRPVAQSIFHLKRTEARLRGVSCWAQAARRPRARKGSRASRPHVWVSLSSKRPSSVLARNKMLQDALISSSCPGGSSSRTLRAPWMKGHLHISQTRSPLPWLHIGWIKGVQAVPREAWAAMKQASFEPNTLRPRGTQPCSQGCLAQRSSRSPHCSRGELPRLLSEAEKEAAGLFTEEEEEEEAAGPSQVEEEEEAAGLS